MGKKSKNSKPIASDAMDNSKCNSEKIEEVHSTTEDSKELSPGEKKLLKQIEKCAKEDAELERRCKENIIYNAVKNSAKGKKLKKSSTASCKMDIDKKVTPDVGDMHNKLHDQKRNLECPETKMSKSHKTLVCGSLHQNAESGTDLSKTDRKISSDMISNNSNTFEVRSMYHGRFQNATESNWENHKYKSNQEKYKGGRPYNEGPSKIQRNDEFEKYMELLESQGITSNGIVQERHGDLFKASTDYSLAHCVAEDMSMGAGIAKTFRKVYGRIGQLLNQNAGTGGLAVLPSENRYIYYLVTKKKSYGKPTMYTLWQSLQKLKEHILKYGVEKLALPQIGCGLDRLVWSNVKQMLEYVFRNTDVEIVVYSMETMSEPTTLLKKSPVIHADYPLVEIDTRNTGLLYLGTEHGDVNNEIRSLETNFYNIIDTYKKINKTKEDVIRSEIQTVCLFGLICKENATEPIDFIALENCLKQLKKLLKKDPSITYLGLQAFIDDNDALIMDKLVNLMKYILYEYEIYICWPKELSQFRPTYNSTD